MGATRRGMLGALALAPIVIAAPAMAAAGADRSAWDIARSGYDKERARDAKVCARFNAAEASGTLTDALETEWDESVGHVCDAEWDLFSVPAPDLKALRWKMQVMVDQHIGFDEDRARILLADVERLAA